MSSPSTDLNSSECGWLFKSGGGAGLTVMLCHITYTSGMFLTQACPCRKSWNAPIHLIISSALVILGTSGDAASLHLSRAFH